MINNKFRFLHPIYLLAAIGCANFTSAQTVEPVDFPLQNLKEIITPLKEATVAIQQTVPDKIGPLNKSLAGGFSDWTYTDLPPTRFHQLKTKIVVDGVEVEKFWEELTLEQWKEKFPHTFSRIIVSQDDSSVGLELPGDVLDIGFKKKNYRISYHNFRFQSYSCETGDITTGDILVGVGVRIVVDVKFRRGDFSLGLPKLALSAEKGKLKGNIDAEVIGLPNFDTLSSMVTSLDGAATFENLVEASNIRSVANQALEVLTPQAPYFLGVRDTTKAGLCLKKRNAELATVIEE